MFLFFGVKKQTFSLFSPLFFGVKKQTSLCFETKLSFLFFSGAEKRGKRDIHLPPSPPYMEGLKRSSSSLVH